MCQISHLKRLWMARPVFLMRAIIKVAVRTYCALEKSPAFGYHATRHYNKDVTRHYSKHIVQIRFKICYLLCIQPLTRQVCLCLFSAVYSYFLIDFLKINFFFYCSYWLHLLLIFCGDIESNPGPGSDRRVRVLYSNIHGLHSNLDKLAVAESDYDVFVCAESKVSDRRHLS